MLTEHKISHAYCVELDDVVDIYEANETYNEEGATSRFTFKCCNEECRALVVGVNYDKPIAKKGMYFRRHKDHPHISTCKWHSENSSKGRSSKRKSVFSNIPEESLFDELVVETRPVGRGVRNSSKTAQQGGTSRTKLKSNSGRVDGRNVTRSFTGVCNLYRELSSDGKKQHYLKIGAQSKSMYAWFWAMTTYRHYVAGNRVNHGHARVYNCLENSLFSVEFEKPVYDFDANNKVLKARFNVSYSSLKNLAGGTLLKRALAEAALTGKPIWCFTFGTAKLKNDSAELSSFIEVCPVSLKCITLMEMDDR